MKNILCWVGSYKWLDGSDRIQPRNGQVRQCIRCNKRQLWLKQLAYMGDWIDEEDYGRLYGILKSMGGEHE